MGTGLQKLLHVNAANAVSSSGVVATLEIFLGLGLTVIEINIKKVQIKNGRCRDGMPKSMQTR